MKGTIDLRNSVLTIPTGLSIQISRTPSGHFAITGREPPKAILSKSPTTEDMNFAMEIQLPVRTLTFEGLKRIRLQLGRWSGNSLTTVLRSSQMHGGGILIRKAVDECKCQTAVRRITPSVACWLKIQWRGGRSGRNVSIPRAF